MFLQKNVYSLWKDLGNYYDLKLKGGRSNKVGTYSDPILKKGRKESYYSILHLQKDLMLSKNGFIHFQKITIFFPVAFGTNCLTLELLTIEDQYEWKHIWNIEQCCWILLLVGFGWITIVLGLTHLSWIAAFIRMYSGPASHPNQIYSNF